MNIELIQKRVENCFSFSHAVNHIEVYEKNSRFYIEQDATCLIELKKIAAEFGDDNIEEFYKLKYCSTVVYMVPRA